MSSTGLESAITAVTEDVNAFLASLPNIGDCLDVRPLLQSMGKASLGVCYMVTVVYIET